MQVEILALRDAVHWCVQRGLSVVRFEGDVKFIIDRLNQAQNNDSRAGPIFREVLSYLSEHIGFLVRFVGRRSNRVAHLMARKALSLYPTPCRSFNFVAWLRSRM
ncbi:unnamed protein product [Linum trigynum]|uniref:RNase H type-1 domain-containing protein n=1 Tax=Linum trigynum TaxID=586398 RepID=A0AAV2CXB6_9ROSI